MSRALKVEYFENDRIYIPVNFIKKASVNKYTGLVKLLMHGGDIETLECATEELLIETHEKLLECGVRVI